MVLINSKLEVNFQFRNKSNYKYNVKKLNILKAAADSTKLILSMTSEINFIDPSNYGTPMMESPPHSGTPKAPQ